MFKINLVPEVKQEQNRVRKLNLTLTTVGVGVAIAILATIIILSTYIFARSAQLSKVNGQIEEINKDLELYKDLEQTVVSLEKGLKEIKQIITGGPKWSKFFGELEKATPTDVQITNFDIKNNEISMSLKGREVKSIDRFIKSFSNYKLNNQNLFTNVKVDGYTKDEGKVTFQAKLNLVGGILW